MFACAVYDLTDELEANLAAEAKDNILRLRNHPSLGLWCGNNEMEGAWLYWGIPQDEKLRQDYTTMFERLIPQWVRTYDRTAFTGRLLRLRAEDSSIRAGRTAEIRITGMYGMERSRLRTLRRSISGSSASMDLKVFRQGRRCGRSSRRISSIWHRRRWRNIRNASTTDLEM